MLIDNVTITIKGGNGGNGRISFRHLPGNYNGGPDGGNGGNGGSVFIQGINDILGLQEFRYRKEVKAEDGIPGGKRNLYGRNGEDITIRLPLGTQVTNLQTGETFEITNEDDLILIAQGGIGGKGNNEFKTATNQAPRIAEKGTPGEEKQLKLELKLIADVGFIGLPNAGKSSLLSVLTNAHPKIGNYPFTTLEPNIGMMGHIALADIPGLIEGAHEGRGLGIEFLRHVEKTELFVHCVSVENEDVTAVYKTIREELKSYSKDLLKKPEIILLTKADMAPEEEVKTKLRELRKTKKKVLPMSIYNKEQLADLQTLLTDFVEKAR